MNLTVLQVIPALGTGGAEQACVDVAAALVRRGDMALVVSSGGRRVADLEDMNAVHIEADVSTKNPVRIIAHAFWMARLIRHRHVDIVHARSRAPAWSAALACIMTGTPFLTTFHAAYKFSSPLKKKYNSVMASADRVIAISDFIARHVHEAYGVGADRLRVIDRGIDLAAFDPACVDEERKGALRRAWGIDGTEAIVILPARLSPIKGHARVIEAMQIMNKQLGRLPLVLFVGDDQGRMKYTEELQASIAAAGLVERIRLVGPCVDMPAAYALADLVLAPSQVPEGFGRVPVEAMTMGVPVIASNLGAYPDTIIKGQTGWLVPPDDAGAWAANISAALELDASARAAMAQNGRERAVARYGLAAMVAKTLAVYDELATLHFRALNSG